MLRMAQRVAVATVAATVGLAAAAGSPVRAQPVRTQIPVVTRLVQIYADHERRLVEAINKRDAAEIDRLVAADFELRTAGNIGIAVPRADWIEQSLKEPPTPVSIGQMAVHDYGDIRIVSFAMKRSEAGRSDPGIAVVDVWQQSGESSVLKTRYAAVLDKPPRQVPDETRNQQIEKRY